MELLTNQTPFEGETIMSFSQRACEDALFRWRAFQRAAFNQRFYSARRGELRFYDWPTLAAKFGVSAERLYALSERSFYVDRADPRDLDSRCLWAAPWTWDKGYSCFSPAALKRSFHWRLEWLLPGQLIDRETETLLLHHCGRCKRLLRDMNWSGLHPHCPRCEHELIEDSEVKPPAKILKAAQKVMSVSAAVFQRTPVDLLSNQARELAATWYAVRALEKHRFPKKLYHRLAEAADVAPYRIPNEKDHDIDPIEAAIQHVQLWAMADSACREQASVLRRYHSMVLWANNGKLCQMAVERGLSELCESFDDS